MCDKTIKTQQEIVIILLKLHDTENFTGGAPFSLPHIHRMLTSVSLTGGFLHIASFKQIDAEGNYLFIFLF